MFKLKLFGFLALFIVNGALANDGFFFYKEVPTPAVKQQNTAPTPNNLTIVGNIDVSKYKDEKGSIPESVLADANLKLQVGDLVLRQNNSWESKAIREIDGTPYSHIAMVTQATPQVYVTHVAADDLADKQYQVIKQPLRDYLAPKMATHFAAYRPSNHFITYSDKQLMASLMEKQQGQPFILASREKAHRYCSSLIYDVMRTRTSSYNPIWKNISYRQYKGAFLTPSSMITRGQFELIMQY